MKKIIFLLACTLIASGTAHAQYISGAPSTIIQDGKTVNKNAPLAVTLAAAPTSTSIGYATGAPINLVQSGNYINGKNPLPVYIAGGLDGYLTSADAANTYATIDELNTQVTNNKETYAQLAVQNVFTSEQHFAYAYFADPDQGVQRDAKFGDKGIAVSGGTKTDTINVTGAATLGGTITATALTGTGTAYACISATGVITRSTTACN